MAGRIIYFADPMCSWCYGFAPHITKIKDHFNETLEFKLVMGGLRPGGNETIGQIGDFLKHHWQEVNKRSGQPFNYDILNEKEFRYDTEPPCRAVIAVRDMDQMKEFEFFKAVQKEFYLHGSNTNQIDIYEHLVEQFGMDKNEFSQTFTSSLLKSKTEKDFVYTQKLGVRGFPTTVLEFDKKLYLLSNGFQEAEIIIPLIDKVLVSEIE